MNGTVRNLHRQGRSIKGIVRTTGVSRQTVRRILAGTRDDVFRSRETTLDRWAGAVERRLGLRVPERCRTVATPARRRVRRQPTRRDGMGDPKAPRHAGVVGPTRRRSNDAGRIAQLKIGATITANYTYDAKNRLSVRQTMAMSPAGTTQYLYDAWDHLLAETDGSGHVVKQYVWAGDEPVAVLDGTVNAASPTLYFVHADHLQRPELMTNATGSVVWRATYEPFGTVSSITGSLVENQRFPGQWFQLEAGLAYNWHRHYDSTTGRYTTPDPLGVRAGPSVYGYVSNNPLVFTDPRRLAIGDFPPPPPGYDPSTWSHGIWDNGTPYVKDPNTGDVYTVHPEDEGHWPHWDKQTLDGKKLGMCPPRSAKPHPNQKTPPYGRQSATNPNEDLPAWSPPTDSPVIELPPEDPIIEIT